MTPQFHDFVIYQLHVGVFSTPNLPRKAGTFLDVADKIPHLAALGVTAIQLLPIQEFSTQFSLGYNGVDYFSPEMDYAVEDADLPPYLARVNRALTAKGLAPYAIDDLRGEMNQLKALIDLCHVHGLAVLLDVVYNHAGGDFGDESIYFSTGNRPRAGTGIRFTSPTADTPAGWSSITANRKCAISSSRTLDFSSKNIGLTDFATIR